MDLKQLVETPPWERPSNTEQRVQYILRDETADDADRILAVELAGDFTTINDTLAADLLAIAASPEADAALRARAATCLGPALEHAETFQFDIPNDIVLSEEMVEDIQKTFRSCFMDSQTPKETRRRILEASVRAPQHWHEKAVREAYDGNDPEWQITAVFCMTYIRGFDTQIIEALRSDNTDMQYHAVCAAGNWGVENAWSHMIGLVNGEDTQKPLLLAAIEAVAGIRPHEAPFVLGYHAYSDDEEIVEAVYEALALMDENLNLNGRIDDFSQARFN